MCTIRTTYFSGLKSQIKLLQKQISKKEDEEEEEKKEEEENKTRTKTKTKQNKKQKIKKHCQLKIADMSKIHCQ